MQEIRDEQVLYLADQRDGFMSQSKRIGHALGALEKLNFKTDDVVVLTVSGRGDKDVETYLNYKL